MRLDRIAAGTFAFLVVRPALGAEPPRAPGIEEIVVTAQRRAENLQDVPIAMTALDEAAIEQRDFTTIADLQHVTPGLVYSESPGLSQPTIRGVGSDLQQSLGDPGVAVYVDDVYLGRPYLPQAALVQIERIEILRGPQGTLYGRNTSGGAIKFVSKKPSDELEVAGGLQYGSLDQKLGKLSVSGPIIGAVRARGSIYYESHDGWLRNLADGDLLAGHEVFSARLAVDVDPTEWLDVSLNADTTRQDDDGPPPQPLGEPRAAALGGRWTADPRATYADHPSVKETEHDGVGATFVADFGLADATVITGYRESAQFQRYDGDGTDLDYLSTLLDLSGRQVSVELQVSSKLDWPVELLVGGFYFDETAKALVDVPILGGITSAFSDADQDTSSYAGFGDASWDVTRWLRFRVGGRYTLDEKNALVTWQFVEMCENQRIDQAWSAFTGRAVGEIPYDEALLVYASFSQGFKAGGVNGFDCDNTFDPEQLDSFETGVKSEWLDGRLRLNGAAFRYDYRNLQVQKIEGLSSLIVNASRAKTIGTEFEATGMLASWISIDGSIGWLDAKYEDFFDDDPNDMPDRGQIDLSGNRMTKSPEWSGHVGVQTVRTLFESLDVTGRVEWTFSNGYFFDPFNDRRDRQHAYDLCNTYVNVDVPAWHVGLQGFAKNLADTTYLTAAYNATPAIGGPYGFYAPPRLLGIEVYARF